MQPSPLSGSPSFHHPRRKPIPLSSHAAFHPPHGCAITYISVFIILPFLNVSYKWSHSICELLYLSLSITFLKSYPIAYFLFYGWIMFHCTGMPHFVYLFILWRTFWVVSVFWLLWVVFWTLIFTFLFEYLCSVLEGVYLEVELMGLTFGGTAKLLSIMMGIFYSLISNAVRF